ncbi:hypothetical protein HOP50_07g48800 [Chloropicon primus]|uniref:Uncharacterized protein n=1 Tax=Chloropicon primus TaxID=1764295 RepID=A0A5B8MSK4_9CHLO|nr:hypothetical protein A3770_07p48600 [Chloropicon primus]UPR01558.1 hypothetical protein HOP50_07g48800 [Chloropicon primus]|eukprot:QDZ22342.1 hypothetical protein A3770_07p48600 [Chloropicon primus]
MTVSRHKGCPSPCHDEDHGTCGVAEGSGSSPAKEKSGFALDREDMQTGLERSVSVMTFLTSLKATGAHKGKREERGATVTQASDQSTAVPLEDVVELISRDKSWGAPRRVGPEDAKDLPGFYSHLNRGFEILLMRHMAALNENLELKQKCHAVKQVCLAQVAELQGARKKAKNA